MFTDDSMELAVLGSDGFNHHQLLIQRRFTRDRIGRLIASLGQRRLLQVLVIDDDRDTTDGLRQLVEHWGHAVQTACNGEAGLKAASRQHPDVVLLDIKMPDMDGFECARRLRLDFSSDQCFIIAVTGRVDDERRTKCQAFGVDLVLLKPVDPAVVETLLALEGKRVSWHQEREAEADRDKIVLPPHRPC